MDTKRSLAEIARKKRHLYLVEKLHGSKGLSRQEIAELDQMEAGRGVTQSGQNLTQIGNPTNPTLKKGRQAKRKKIFLELFATVSGSISEACEKAGVDRSTVYKWQRDDQAFAEGMEAIREGLVDFAESKLLDLVRQGNPTAVIFMLKCLGKSRGYVERQEVLDVKAIDQMASTVAGIVRSVLKENIQDESLRKKILEEARERVKKLVEKEK